MHTATEIPGSQPASAGAVGPARSPPEETMGGVLRSGRGMQAAQLAPRPQGIQDSRAIAPSTPCRKKSFYLIIVSERSKESHSCENLRECPSDDPAHGGSAGTWRE